ncbi:MAG TPA: UDP-N-acetylmuramoyl-L-alanyl-D-glutamate--2,6-diaminopimelate ligase [Sedimentisphaerales bacterium]|nr:UDP-N-acetylmuramoyl-L-alanyl-D-glutamate--2,6-diaminopimelate ligase [Sedimentisphaerales bacterium]
MVFEELLKIVSSNKNMNVCSDSRLVKEGDVFVAIKGSVCDGHDFMDSARANGAGYIVSQKICNCKGAKLVLVDDTTQALGMLVQASKDNPASKLTCFAVTGTNGKTTVAFLVQSVVQHAGFKCGLIGTILYDTGLKRLHSPMTTPDSIAIADMTSQMVEAGSKYMVLEASSHALDQNRLATINFKAAAFTNLTGDHLDYHKTEECYLEAKTLLFKNLSKESTAVLNQQSPHAKKIAAQTKANIIWYAVDEEADLTATIKRMDVGGTEFVMSYKGEQQILKTPLIGLYNISNLLAAGGLCLAGGFDLETTARGLEAMKVIPGRLEKVECDADFSVVIDFAHTDDALTNVLKTLKLICKGRLIVVFGCGGNRDRTKRPRMAKAAEKYADFIVVTSDNPRGEQAEYIIGEIMTGFDNPVSENIEVEIERADAIKLAIDMAKKDDIVLIAGKGHETYQIIGTEKIEFSDQKVALECLRNKK